jgi:hypothetical protein
MNMKKPAKNHHGKKSDDWESYWRFCVRLKGQDGWRLEEAACDRDAFIALLHSQGVDEAEVVEVGRGGRRVGYVSSDDGESAKGWGWCFDEQGDCWRAPDEALIPPPGAPVTVDSVAATFMPPRSGWIRTTLKAGEQSVEFEISNVYDPVIDIVQWLEKLLDGGHPRLMMNMEGWFCEFHIFPADAGDEEEVRFVVVEMNYGRKIALDIRINRTALLAGLYNTLVSYWESDAFAQEWDEWDYMPLYEDDPECDDPDAEGIRVFTSPYSIRSAKIDAALRAAGRTEG